MLSSGTKGCIENEWVKKNLPINSGFKVIDIRFQRYFAGKKFQGLVLRGKTDNFLTSKNSNIKSCKLLEYRDKDKDYPSQIRKWNQFS